MRIFGKCVMLSWFLKKFSRIGYCAGTLSSAFCKHSLIIILERNCTLIAFIFLQLMVFCTLCTCSFLLDTEQKKDEEMERKAELKLTNTWDGAQFFNTIPFVPSCSWMFIILIVLIRTRCEYVAFGECCILHFIR